MTALVLASGAFGRQPGIGEANWTIRFPLVQGADMASPKTANASPGWQVAVRARLFTFGLHCDIPLFCGAFSCLCAPNNSLFFGF